MLALRFPVAACSLALFKRLKSRVSLAALAFVLAAVALPATSLMENLDRGLVAIRTSPTSTFLSWRYLGTDSPDIAFNVYRATGGGAPVKLNGAPLATVTNFSDDSTDSAQDNSYTVRAVLYGVELAADKSFTIPANAPAQNYLNIPLQIPDGGTIGGTSYTYSANDCSVADLDGDGTYEIIVKWDPSNAQDNANSGTTANAIIDAYKLDGTLLWRIDLGRNIRAIVKPVTPVSRCLSVHMFHTTGKKTLTHSKPQQFELGCSNKHVSHEGTKTQN
jgi:rhamnogalacturonan endolyase